MRSGIICCLLLFCLIARGQTPARNTQGVQPPSGATGSLSEAGRSPDQILLQYEVALNTEAKAHRDYLKESFDQFKLFAVGLVALGAAIFTWLNLNNSKEIRAQVDARIKSDVETSFNKQLAEFNGFLEQNKKKIEDIARAMDKVRNDQQKSIHEVDRLTERFAEIASTLTYGFSALVEKSDGPEWQSARREAIRQIEILRREFPHWRRVGILLGRLHVRLGEYNDAIRVLTEVMDARDGKRMHPDADYAGLLYNRACYRNRVAEKENGQAESEAKRVAAWKDLERSVKIDPENRSEAFRDPDFHSLWNDSDRKRENLEEKPSHPAKAGIWPRLIAFFMEPDAKTPNGSPG